MYAFLGDSFTEGQWISTPLLAFPYLSVDSDDSVYVNGRGGSGYTRSGACPDSLAIDRVDAVLAVDPDVVVIAFGRNDVGNDVTAAASGVLDRIQASQYSGRTLVVGPFDSPSADAGEISAINAQLERVASNHGVGFVDPAGWVTDWLPDNNHPTQLGHEQIADHLGNVLSSAG